MAADQRPADGEDGGPAAEPGQPTSGAPDIPSYNYYEPRPDVPTASNYKVMHTLEGHTGAVTSIKFQRDGLLAASGSADGTAKIWDVKEGRCIHTLQGHKKGINDVVWSWDGNIIATASDDRTVRIWDVRTRQCVRKLEGHTNFVMSCSFSAPGDTLASAGFDETIRLWCMHTGKLIRVIPAHSDPLLCLDFSADLSKPVLASASKDGICRVWLSHSGECGRSIIPDSAENPCLPVTFCKFTPNNKFLLLGTMAGRLQLWDFESKISGMGFLPPVSVKKTYVGHRNSRHVLQAAFMVNEPTGNKYVVCGSEDHHVFLWDLNQRSIAGILRGRSGPDSPGDGHCDVVLSVDTNTLEPIIGSAGGTKDKTVKLWRYEA
jgi:COMPASS component SWD3